MLVISSSTSAHRHARTKRSVTSWRRRPPRTPLTTRNVVRADRHVTPTRQRPNAQVISAVAGLLDIGWGEISPASGFCTAPRTNQAAFSQTSHVAANWVRAALSRRAPDYRRSRRSSDPAIAHTTSFGVRPRFGLLRLVALLPACYVDATVAAPMEGRRGSSASPGTRFSG